MAPQPRGYAICHHLFGYQEVRWVHAEEFSMMRCLDVMIDQTVSRSGFKVRTARRAAERPVRSLNLDRETVLKDSYL